MHSPVDDAGNFTSEAANGKFTGLNVLDEGNQAVIDYMQTSGSLLVEEKYQHKYPYDWRTKKPTIFRATEQVRVRTKSALHPYLYPIASLF